MLELITGVVLCAHKRARQLVSVCDSDCASVQSASYKSAKSHGSCPGLSAVCPRTAAGIDGSPSAGSERARCLIPMGAGRASTWNVLEAWHSRAAPPRQEPCSRAAPVHLMMTTRALPLILMVCRRWSSSDHALDQAEEGLKSIRVAVAGEA